MVGGESELSVLYGHWRIPLAARPAGQKTRHSNQRSSWSSTSNSHGNGSGSLSTGGAEKHLDQQNRHRCANREFCHYSRSAVGLVCPNQFRLLANHENHSNAAAKAMTSAGMTMPDGPMTCIPPPMIMV